MKIPKSLAVCADLLYSTRQERLELQKQVEAMQAEETAIKMHLMMQLPAKDASGIAGKLARVTLEVDTVPKVDDWDKLYAHIVKTKSWDLLQRRLGGEAVKLRWADGKKVPGVNPIEIPVIRVNKV